MKKWKCVAVWCCGKFHCAAECGNGPQKCLMSGVDVTWDEVNEPPLPKLTTEVFNRPDCPEWARFAAADEDGSGFWIENKPQPMIHAWVGCGKSGIIKGKFDASDWKHSIIERPVKQEEPPTVPDWCKVGAWVWVSGDYGVVDGYQEIKSIDVDPDWVNFCGGDCAATRNANKTFFEARVRPWTASEAIGKIVWIGKSKNYYVVISAHDSGKCTLTFGIDMKLSDLSKGNYRHMDGSPCGVLQHIENGKWVE